MKTGFQKKKHLNIFESTFTISCTGDNHDEMQAYNVMDLFSRTETGLQL